MKKLQCHLELLKLRCPFCLKKAAGNLLEQEDFLRAMIYSFRHFVLRENRKLVLADQNDCTEELEATCLSLVHQLSERGMESSHLVSDEARSVVV